MPCVSPTDQLSTGPHGRGCYGLRGQVTLRAANNSSLVFGQHPVNSCAANPQRRSNGGHRLAGCLLSSGQRGFGWVESLRTTDGLAPCAAGLAGCGVPLAAQLKLQLGKAGKNARHHPARGVGGVDPLAQRPQDDVPLAVDVEVQRGLLSRRLHGVAARDSEVSRLHQTTQPPVPSRGRSSDMWIQSVTTCSGSSTPVTFVPKPLPGGKSHPAAIVHP